MCLERRSGQGDSGTRVFGTRVLARKDIGDSSSDQGFWGQGTLSTRDFEHKGFLSNGND
jgi:hypothetical protein